VNTFILVDEYCRFFARIAWVGNLTYSSCLIHFPIQLSLVMVIDALHEPRTLFLSPVAFLTFFAVTFGLAWTVYHLYEMPMQEMIRTRWFAASMRPVVVPAVSAVADYRHQKGPRGV
jgi:peptidoglycan/LPS O-acetylase OafA/YrhL